MADFACCSQCGGQGFIDAASFNEYGWHSCYRCGETGNIDISSEVNILLGGGGLYSAYEDRLIYLPESHSKDRKDVVGFIEINGLGRLY